ncbi:hypothetical protein EVAR_56607_1 [Eumeta japonica]|uniref:Uncharacterized protein n=1 Tax=Eumeta variegata TaxID=151549 RepID=A0A4C1YWD5_EUMVA|nr:hypothetical protein EVAR_56607_1 [Eumeta japonica]
MSIEVIEGEAESSRRPAPEGCWLIVRRGARVRTPVRVQSLLALPFLWWRVCRLCRLALGATPAAPSADVCKRESRLTHFVTCRVIARLAVHRAHRSHSSWCGVE